MESKELVTVIDNYISPDSQEDVRTEALNQILLGVHGKRINVQQIVEKLGDYLTSTNDVIRSRGTLLLSEIFTRLPTLQLNRQSVQTFVQFYCDRLLDYTSQPEVLKGICSLLKNQALADKEPEKLVRAMFSEVHVQSCALQTRALIFEIFAVLFSKYLQAMKDMKSDFVLGFVQSLDGEKDPRILVNAFELIPTITKEIPEFARFAEDLFEVVSCYFPVTFNPKPGDPEAISRQDLINALRNCMSCTPTFAQYSIPFLLEKISSSIVDTKVDSLETLSQCIKAYGNDVLAPNAIGIWEALSQEITSSKEASVVQAACLCLQSLVGILVAEPLQNLLKSIFTTCTHELQSGDVLMTQACNQILYHVAKASKPACQFVISNTFPLIFKEFSSKSSLNFRRTLLEFTINLITASLSVYTEGAQLSPLEPLKLQIYEFLSSSLIVSDNDEEGVASLRASAILGLSLLVANGLTSTEHTKAVVQRTTKLLFEELSNTVKNQCLFALSQLCKTHAAMILSDSVPSVMESLHMARSQLTEHDEVAKILAQDGKQKSMMNVSLNTIASLAKSELIFHSIVPQILTLLRSSLLEEGKPARLFSTCILIALSTISSSVDHSLQYYTTNVLPALLSSAIIRSFLTKNELDSQILDAYIRLFRTVVQRLDVSLQTPFISDMLSLFIEGNPKLIQPFMDRTVDGFRPFGEIPSQRQLQVLLYVSIIYLRKEVQLSHVLQILQLLEPSEYSVYCIASVINKLPEGPVLTEALEALVSKRILLALESNSIKSDNERLLIVLLWVTRALVMRSHPLGNQLTKYLIEKLNSPMGTLIAQNFDILMGDQILNKENYANIKVLYKQKLFLSTLPILISGFHNCKHAEEQANFFSAISKMLKHVPKSVLLGELPSVLPIIVQSVTSTEPILKNSTLLTLLELIGDAPTLIGAHIHKLMPEFINSVTSPQKNIRESALKCLFALARNNKVQVLSYRDRVTQAIRGVLDDKKRVVRKEAVRTLNEYLLMGNTK